MLLLLPDSLNTSKPMPNASFQIYSACFLVDGSFTKLIVRNKHYCHLFKGWINYNIAQENDNRKAISLEQQIFFAKNCCVSSSLFSLYTEFKQKIDFWHRYSIDYLSATH